LETGHQVTVLDRVQPEQRVRFIRCDILELGDLVYALGGQDAVIHLAAIPHPLFDPPQRVMEVNVMGTFNVLEAAARVGVPQVVMASTDSTLGFVFATHDFDPEYLPIDEEHPLKPQDPYGLSKALGEGMCKSYTRRYGMSTICVRICFICDTRAINEHREWMVNEEDIRRGNRGLWVYTDGRDAAQAFRLAAEAKGFEHEAFFVPEDDGRNTVPTAELVERYYPEVPVNRGIVEGNYWSMITNAKAKKMLGYTPQYSWRNYYRQV
jgi:nucleoside-diphosphate-sugar epimerase